MQLTYTFTLISLAFIGIGMMSCDDHAEEIYELNVIQANSGTVDNTSRSFLDVEYTHATTSSDDASGLGISTALSTDTSN